MNELIFATAKAKIGIWEWAQGSNPLIMDMFRKSGFPDVADDATPWCAAFVGAVLAEVGLVGTGSLLARSYLKWGTHVPSSEAERGDVLIFTRGPRDGWQGHVTFFDSYDGSYVNCLGGNQKDGVNISRYLREDLLGVRRAIAPRKSPAQSKTLQGLAGLFGALGVSAFMADSLEVIIPLVIAGGIGVFIFRERLKAWEGGRK